MRAYLLLAAPLILALCIAAPQRQPQPQTTASATPAADLAAIHNLLAYEIVPVSATGSHAYADLAADNAVQELTPVPAGPFHVVRNRIIDSKGRPFLMRGTQLTEFRPQTAAHDDRSGEEFGPHSATSLSAIRLRFNMNAVRLPVNVLDAADPGYFSELAKVVRRANRINLLVILAAREPGASLPSRRTAEFWRRGAAFFKDYPNVMFDVFSDPAPSVVPQNIGDSHSAVGWNFWKHGGPEATRMARDVIGMQGLVDAIRSAGAAQPIVVTGWQDGRLFEGAGPAPLIDDPNVIYEASPRYSSTRTDGDRDAHFGFLANRVPLLVGWDLGLDDAAECSVIPSDPTAAGELVHETLDYFDTHEISWTVSVFEPGKLITDSSFFSPTSLDDGWTCGQKRWPAAGLGRVVQTHLRTAEERGLFVVSPSGGMDLARGGYAFGYGPVMAERDLQSDGQHLPLTLGGNSVQVTDVLGVTRPAELRWVSAGWGQVNFLIPAESAPGPGLMTLLRSDGSSTSAPITIADTAPGFFTDVSCAGPAIGSATQIFADDRASTSSLSSCAAGNCRAHPIPVTPGATTRVRLLGNGFRYARSADDILVTIAGTRVPVVSFGPTDDPGVDQVTVEIPAVMRELGETDLLSYVNGRVSNAVLIRMGRAKRVS